MRKTVNGKISVERNQFDERQKMFRGRGFMYGYLVLLFLSAFINTGEIFTNCLNEFTCFSICAWPSMAVIFIYFIVHDAFEGINVTGRKTFMVIYTLCGLLNLIAPLYHLFIKGEPATVDGIAGDWVGNLSCGLCMTVVSVVYFIKVMKNRKNLEEE